MTHPVKSRPDTTIKDRLFAAPTDDPIESTEKKEKRPRVPRGELITALDARFGKMTDAQIVQNLNFSGTLKAWADENLLPLFPKNDLPIGASEPDYHGAITYYLNTWRPAILKSFEDKAEILSKQWPTNHSDILKELHMGGWWARTLRRRLNDNIRVEMDGKNLAAWIERIWPAVLGLLERGLYRNDPPYVIVDDLRKRLSLPRTIKVGARNLYFDFQQLLRQKVAAHLRKTRKKHVEGLDMAPGRLSKPKPRKVATKSPVKPAAKPAPKVKTTTAKKAAIKKAAKPATKATRAITKTKAPVKASRKKTTSKAATR